MRTRARTVAVALRAAVLVAGAVLVVTLPVHSWLPVTATVVGVLLAAARPAEIGMTGAGLAVVASWTLGAGLHHHPPVATTVVAAAALYLLHLTTRVAAFVPLDGHVQAAGARAPLQRAVPTVLVSALVIGLDYALGERRGPALYTAAGVVAVVLIALALTVRTLARRV